MPSTRHHAEWLSLVEVSGPFLTMPVLEKVFPQGLDAHEPEHVRNLRVAFDEWETNQTSRRPNPAIHKAWIDYVLKQTLGLPEEVIAESQAIPQTLKATISEHGETLRPEIVVRNPPHPQPLSPEGRGKNQEEKPRLLVQVYPTDQDLEKPVAGRHWKSSPSTRMMELLHATDIRLGLVTNGDRWMLVDAPRGDTTGFASWYAALWFEEPLTLRAFCSLLGVRRFFSVGDDETLEEMLKESAKYQNEVTDQLGRQVRHAVEVLIQSLDRADQDDKVLAGVPETVLYEAALTVMMRLVFLFSAEERGLLLLGDPLYDQHYAVSTLVAQLQEAADQHGEEVLERRFDGWVRLLSTFRAVFGGVQHERMKLPAYAGNLFNPDRFPFLEGRRGARPASAPGGEWSWRNQPANPLPINNRTVLHLLRSLQYLELQGEARRLSFRALDIEQIGHVYEGLLDHTAKRAAEPMLGLLGAKGLEPEIALAELERLHKKSEAELLKFLNDETGRQEKSLKRGLDTPLDGDDAKKLKAACGTDEKLFARLRPYSGLLRNDTFDRPVVIRTGSVFVTAGTDRRSSGTHYTPRSLTEPIVQYTLEPLVYVGPAEGKPKEEWTLRPAKELLDLKICDMACGSGAFLVQACRYMSERLVEAWEDAEKRHPGVPGITPEGNVSTGAPGELLIPKETDERLVYARRIVAQRCLYGVDKNPLAVEMAKLSLWLLTLAKDRPFTFLDHAIRCGDSLVGIHKLDQLRHLSLSGRQEVAPAFVERLERAVNDSLQLRQKLEAVNATSVEQIAEQERLNRKAETLTASLKAAADLLIADEFTGEQNGLLKVITRFAKGETTELLNDAKQALNGQPTFHWALEFPEVMLSRGGFDAFVCNPPFMGGKKITGNLQTEYRNYLVSHLAKGQPGSADLCAYFFLRAKESLRDSGHLGFLATNTIAQGDTREVGLDLLVGDGCTITRAVASRKWPGTANLEVAHVWVRRGSWLGDSILDDSLVDGITAFLKSIGTVTGKPYRLNANADKSFIGSVLSGIGFVLTPKEAIALTESDKRNKDVLFPYLSGDDLNSRFDQSPSRWVINFLDWPLDRKTASDGYKGPVAEDYSDCLAIVRERVKPHRDQVKRRVYRELWWQFAEKCLNLYRAVEGFKQVLVCPIVTKHLSFAFAPVGIVYMHKLCVFAIGGPSAFALLSSNFHEPWAREFSSTLESRLNYSPTDCFETFPFPTLQNDSLMRIGEEYYDFRRRLMETEKEGLTQTYNRFHDSEETAQDIQKLRDLHVSMDNAVAAAYGWTDLDLGHGFHETKQGVRYTISEAARREVLARLLKLNHERYAEEVAQGLHDKKGKARKAAGTRGRKPKAGAEPQPELFP